MYIYIFIYNKYKERCKNPNKSLFFIISILLARVVKVCNIVPYRPNIESNFSWIILANIRIVIELLLGNVRNGVLYN